MTEIERIKAACERLPSKTQDNLWDEASKEVGVRPEWTHRADYDAARMLGVQLALAERKWWGRPRVYMGNGKWSYACDYVTRLNHFQTYPAALAALCEALAERYAEIPPECTTPARDIWETVEDLRRRVELADQHCSQAYNIARHNETSINGMRQDIGRLRDRVSSCETWRTDQLAGSREHLKRIEKLEQWWRNDHRMSLAEPLRGFTVATKQDIEATEESK